MVAILDELELPGMPISIAGLGRSGHDPVTARPGYEYTGAPWPVSSSLVGSALIRSADASA